MSCTLETARRMSHGLPESDRQEFLEAMVEGYDLDPEDVTADDLTTAFETVFLSLSDVGRKQLATVIEGLHELEEHDPSE